METLTFSEQEFIKKAHHFLERESFLLRLANTLGKPADVVQRALPAPIKEKVSGAVHKALRAALKTSLRSLPESGSREHEKALQSSLEGSRKNRLLHGVMAMASGGIGGFFGIGGLVFDLPVTTTIMMRNIAAIAEQFGFSKEDPQTAMECLYVFSLGSRSSHDDQLDSAYYTSRLAMASALRNSAQYVASTSSAALFESLRKGSAPVVVNFIARVAGYFEIVVTEKMIAGAVPIIGSLGAASVNLAFTDYFGQAAQYHFGLLALERKYGEGVVQAAYKSAH